MDEASVNAAARKYTREVPFGVRREAFDTEDSFIHLSITAEKNTSPFPLYLKEGAEISG